MDRAQIACPRHPHASRYQLVGVGFAFVAQHVCLIGDEKRRRLPLQLVERGTQRRRRRLFAGLHVRRVGVPEPAHRLAGEPGTIGELLVRWRVEGCVRCRIEQYLVVDSRPATLLGEQEHRGDHIAADAVAGQGESRRVEADLGAVLRRPDGRRVGLFDGDGIARLWRRRIVDEDHRGLRAVGDLTHEAVVGLFVAQDPAAAMEVHHHRQGAGCALRPDDANRHLAGWPARDHAVFDVRGELRDGDGRLHVGKHGAGIGWGQRVEGRATPGRKLRNEGLCDRVKGEGLGAY